MVGAGPRQEPRAPPGRPRPGRQRGARSGGGRSALPGPRSRSARFWFPFACSREGSFLFNLKIDTSLCKSILQRISTSTHALSVGKGGGEGRGGGEGTRETPSSAGSPSARGWEGAASPRHTEEAAPVWDGGGEGVSTHPPT